MNHKKVGLHNRISKSSSWKGWIAFALVLAVPLELGSEMITLSTTYPSPVGIYNRLITTGATNSPSGDTILNRDGGNLILVANNPNSYVGIGTGSDLPHVKLDVRGLIQIGTDNQTACTTNIAGAVRWFVKQGDVNTKTLQACDGSSWMKVSLSSLTPSGSCSQVGSTMNGTIECSCGSTGSLIWNGTQQYTCASNPDGSSSWQATGPQNCPPPLNYSCS